MGTRDRPTSLGFLLPNQVARSLQGNASVIWRAIHSYFSLRGLR